MSGYLDECSVRLKGGAFCHGNVTTYVRMRNNT